MAEIVIESVSKAFGQVSAVEDVSLTVHEGELLVLLGPSGCGKSTLLRMVAGFEAPDSGRIHIGGRDVTDAAPRERGFAMVFQSYALFPHMRVKDNIGFGLRMHGVAKERRPGRIGQTAQLLEIAPLLDRFPSELSGGQRQRVAVARALVMEPDVLLMDEPLSNLDAVLRLQFRTELKRLLQEVRTTTIYVTHDQVEALSLGNRAAVMHAGRIVQCDAPLRVYDRPATAFVAGFIGSPPMNVLQGHLHHADGRFAVVVGEGITLVVDEPPAESRRDGDSVAVGIRAENIEVLEQETEDALVAELLVVEPLGSHSMLTLRLAGQSMTALAGADFSRRPGEKLAIRPAPGKLRWLEP